MSQRVHLASKSGTCEICSDPCSSCMHHNGVHMGSKGNEFADVSCHGNAPNQYSINEGDALPVVKSSVRENQQQAATETSNEVSVSSSHDSFTHNTENKAFTRSSNIADSSEDVAVLQKLTSGGTVAKDPLSPNPLCDFDQKASCIGDYKGIEGHDEHTSCVSTSKNSSAIDDCPNRKVDLKNIYCSSISAGSKVATASVDEDSSEKHICVDSVAPGRCADNSIQKGLPNLLVDVSFNNLDAAGLPLQENIDAIASSLKVQVLSSSQSHAFPHNADVKGLEVNTSSQALDKLSEPLIESMNLSVQETAPDIAYSSKSAAREHNKDLLIGEGSKVTEETSPKSKLEVEEEIGGQLDATFKCSDQTEDVDMLKEVDQLPRVQESPSESQSGDETGESDIVEQDVKVCDICGDAGREDLLAVCSRCSDGAEHTYCMREMLKKVPEGEWLCEECKFAKESENRIQCEPDGESGSASSHSSGHSINEHSLKLDVKGPKADAKATSKVSSSPRISGKRTSEAIEVGSPVKRQAVEASIGSPKPNPIRVSALSREPSFKSSEKGKVRLAHQNSIGTHCSNDFAESARSPSNGARSQISKGALLKSNSFSTGSSKHKVKLVDDIPLKQKGLRDASLGMKDGAVRMLGKSMSFKSTNSAPSNGTESRVKMFSPKISQDQDFKGLKHSKDWNTFEWKSLSKLDRPLVGSAKTSSAVSSPKGYHKLTARGESSPLSISNNRDLKVGQSDGKIASLSRSTSNLGRRGTETTGVSGGISSGDQKSCKLNHKEEPSSSSSTAERPSSNANGGLQDGPLLLESTNQAEKVKASSTGRSRQIARTGLRMAACQKCKEIGHDAELFSVVSPRGSGIDVSTARSSREEMKEGNKLKAAIDAAMRKKPGIYKKKQANINVEELSVSNTDVNGELAQDKSSVPSTLKNMITAGGMHDGLAVLQRSTSDYYKPMIVNNTEQTALNEREAADTLKVEDAETCFASDGKSVVREVTNNVLAVVTACKTGAIPEHQFIWQGNFELHRGRKQPELCAGIQSHVSTSASRKVVEVMNTFPQNVSFSEVPRLSTWPLQFHESGAKEENIALYFFAKDLESYQKNYNLLVERMIRNDLALIGNLNGIELLVFPSNQLPEKFQRWNMLFFLWGVFRGKKANGSNYTSGSSHKLFTVDKDVPGTQISSSENHSRNLSPCDKSFVVSAFDSPVGNSNGNCNVKLEPVDQKCLRKVAFSEQQHSAVESHSSPKIQRSSSVPDQESIVTDTPMKEASDLGSTWGVDLQPSVRSFGANSNYNEVKMAAHWDTTVDKQKFGTRSRETLLPVGDHKVNIGSLNDKKRLDVVDSGKGAAKLELDLMKDVSMSREASLETRNEEPNNWQFGRKRPHIDLGETPLEATGTSQNVSWSSVINNSAEGQIKKAKTGVGVYEYEDPRDEVSKSGGCGTEKGYERPCDKKVILEDLGTAERFFFPVNVNEMQQSNPWKVPSSEHQERVPNLELALGGERKLGNKGFLPFLGGMVDKQYNHRDLPDKATVKEEEDVSASLSLSLAFPFLEKEEAAPRTEQQQQQQRVNTSLLLFGGFPDK